MNCFVSEGFLKHGLGYKKGQHKKKRQHRRSEQEQKQEQRFSPYRAKRSAKEVDTFGRLCMVVYIEPFFGAFIHVLEDVKG